MARAVLPVFSGGDPFAVSSPDVSHRRAMAGGRFVQLRARALGLVVCCCQGASFPSKQIIHPAGPITRITVGQDGSLQVEHQDYQSIGQFYPKTVWPADCGIFLRHNGKVDGMDFTRHEGTMAYNTQAIAFQPVAQTQSTDGYLVQR